MTSNNKLTPQDRKSAIEALTALKQLPDNAGHRGVINNAIQFNQQQIKQASQQAQQIEEENKQKIAEAINTALTEHLEANPVSIPIIRTF